MTDPAAPVLSLSIDDLIRRHDDQQFVQVAYQALLGRQADADGLQTYVTLLRQGMSKSDILCALAVSEEGRAQETARKPAGLDGLLRNQHARLHPSLLQRMWRRLLGPAVFDQAQETQRELRVAANRSYVLEQLLGQLQQDLKQTRADLAEVKELVAAGGQSSSAGAAARGSASQPLPGPGHDPVPPRASTWLHAMRRFSAARHGRAH